MSMLAERKRKQKWSLNPRGKDWSEDSNKFGQKMLEKMGWSKGKGLGAKEDGITEHIKLSYKNDSKGMGYKENSDQWTEHEQNFSKLLQSLGGSENGDVQVKSLEKKSQNSRARVHYHKFTRGKDLSRYSEKDLANIFGKKSLKEEPKIIEKVEVEEVKGPNELLVNSGSMMDYFKKKLPSFGKNGTGFVLGNNGVLKKEEIVSEEEETNLRGFGFEKDKKSTFVSYINSAETETKRKKKKRKATEETIKAFTPNKKKKEEDNLGVSNPAFDPMHTPIKFEKHSLEVIDESVKEESSFEENNGGPVEVSVEINNEETPPKKKKRKQKNSTENMEERDTFEVTIKRKKEKRKEGTLGIDNETFEEISQDNGVLNEEFEVERREKKKKRKIVESLGIDNQIFEETSQDNGVLNEEFEVERREKKKKRKIVESMGIDNQIFEETSQDTSEFSVEFEVKRKEKKKRKKEKENLEVGDQKKKKKVVEGVVNPALNLTDIKDEESFNNFDLMMNIVATPSSQIKNRKSVRFSDVNEERIIPNLEQLEEMQQKNELFDINTMVINESITKQEIAYDMEEIDRINFNRVKKNKGKNKKGLSNLAFDEEAAKIQENCDEMSKKFDAYQAEVENDLNEQKLRLEDLMVGEVGNPEGENEKLPCGALKLKFKNAKFGKMPNYISCLTGARKSYKHLIKGDIIVDFKGSNFHEINGYAIKKEV